MKLQDKARKLMSQGAMDRQGPSNKNLQSTRVSMGEQRKAMPGAPKGPTSAS